MSEIQAGWYQDPSGDATRLRYWDGAQWTEDYQSIPTPAPTQQHSVPGGDGVMPTQAENASVPGAYPAEPYMPGSLNPYAQVVYMQPQAQSANGYAIAALVCGIVGVCSCGIYSLGIPSLVAIILGAVGKKKPGSRGLAIAGLVLGIIGLAIGLLVIAVFLINYYAIRQNYYTYF